MLPPTSIVFGLVTAVVVFILSTLRTTAAFCTCLVCHVASENRSQDWAASSDDEAFCQRCRESPLFEVYRIVPALEWSHFAISVGVTIFAVITARFIFRLSRLVFRQLRFVYAHFVRKPYDLGERYGVGSWAVITGASGGIGLGFAVQLAKAGFNIVMISRSLDNLSVAADEVVAAGRENGYDTRTKTVVTNFKEGSSLAFWEAWLAEVQAPLHPEDAAPLDISILVNNVGMNETDHFDRVNPQTLLDMIAVNCTSQLMATRMLITAMIKRCEDSPSSSNVKRKCAIISLSSIAGQRPLMYLAPYSATKAFNDFFSRALALEFGDRMDFLSCRPAYVVSAMSQIKETGGFVIDRYECARGCLEKLGYVTETYGPARHAIYARTYAWFPEWWVARIRRARLLAKKKNAALVSK